MRKPVRNLSLGERMKCELAAGLLHRPKVLFLDEPTIGLDITAQARIRSFLQEYNRRTGATILLTSHYMADVTALCERIIIIHQGRLKYDGAMNDLTRRIAPFKLIGVALGDPCPCDLSPYGTPMPGGRRGWQTVRPGACRRSGRHYRAYAGGPAHSRPDHRRPAHRRRHRAGFPGIEALMLQHLQTLLAGELGGTMAVPRQPDDVPVLLAGLAGQSTWQSGSRIANSQGSVSGLTANDFVTYYLTLLIVDQLTSDITIHILAYKIQDGTLSGDLIRPIHPILTSTLVYNIAFKALDLHGADPGLDRPFAALPPRLLPPSRCNPCSWRFRRF